MTEDRRHECLSFKPRRPSAADAVGPPHVDLAAARRTLELPRGRLATVGAEIDLPIGWERPATVRATMRRYRFLWLCKLERRRGHGLLDLGTILGRQRYRGNWIL